MDNASASVLGREQAAARTLLRDFKKSGVDEDLEILRSMWNKPPTPPGSDDEEMAAYRRGSGRPPWRGPLERPRVVKTNTADRVRGGALDYHSSERLGTLNMLRNIAEAPCDEMGAMVHPSPSAMA